jgi:hypothetical protein
MSPRYLHITLTVVVVVRIGKKVEKIFSISLGVLFLGAW